MFLVYLDCIRTLFKKSMRTRSASQSHHLASSSSCLLLARPRWPWPISSFHPRSVVLLSTSTILPSLPAFLPSVSLLFHSISPLADSLSPCLALFLSWSYCKLHKLSPRLFFTLLHFHSVPSPPLSPSIAAPSNSGRGRCYLLFDRPCISFRVPEWWIYFKHVEPRCLKCGAW